MIARHLFLTMLALSLAGESAQAGAREDCLGYAGDPAGADTAILACTRVVRENAKDAESYASRGIAYLSRFDVKRAVTDFTRAIDLDAKSARFRNERGKAYLVSNDAARAIADFSKAIELDPKDPSAYNFRGVAYREQNELARALADLDKAIEIEPTYAGAYFNRGVTLLRKSEAGTAPAPVFPKDGLLNMLADRDTSDQKRALGDFDKAIESDVDFIEAYEARSALRQQLGDQAGSIADKAKADTLRTR